MINFQTENCSCLLHLLLVFHNSQKYSKFVQFLFINIIHTAWDADNDQCSEFLPSSALLWIKMMLGEIKWI